MKPIYVWLIGALVVTVGIVSLRGCSQDPFASGELPIGKIDWGEYADSSNANIPYVYVSKSKDGTFNMTTIIPHSAGKVVVYKDSVYDATGHSYTARFTETDDATAEEGVFAFETTDIPADVTKVAAGLAGGTDGTVVMTAEGDDEGIFHGVTDVVALHSETVPGGQILVTGFIYTHDSYSVTRGTEAPNSAGEQELTMKLTSSTGTPDQVAFIKQPMHFVTGVRRYRVRLVYSPSGDPGRSFCFIP